MWGKERQSLSNKEEGVYLSSTCTPCQEDHPLTAPPPHTHTHVTGTPSACQEDHPCTHRPPHTHTHTSQAPHTSHTHVTGHLLRRPPTLDWRKLRMNLSKNQLQLLARRSNFKTCLGYTLLFVLTCMFITHDLCVCSLPMSPDCVITVLCLEPHAGNVCYIIAKLVTLFGENIYIYVHHSVKMLCKTILLSFCSIGLGIKNVNSAT